VSDLKKHLALADVNIDKFISGMQSATEAMKLYSKLDMKQILYVNRRLAKKLYPKPKHRSCFRTVSDRKWAGHKRNKPRYDWSKKRKRLGGWKV
jgi:hypothetical protein